MQLPSVLCGNRSVNKTEVGTLHSFRYMMFFFLGQAVCYENACCLMLWYNVGWSQRLLRVSVHLRSALHIQMIHTQNKDIAPAGVYLLIWLCHQLITLGASRIIHFLAVSFIKRWNHIFLLYLLPVNFHCLHQEFVLDQLEISYCTLLKDLL